MNGEVDLDNSAGSSTALSSQRESGNARRRPRRGLRPQSGPSSQTRQLRTAGERGADRGTSAVDASASGDTECKRWLTRAEAGDYMGVHPRTLANWAARGCGPRYSKPSGNSCMYRIEDLDAYLEAHLVHTDEQPEAA
ncbi:MULTISPECIES: helix-turn-helix transcriptional regulator [Nocardia]|uniref:DNA-binding protein n=1 Tax=Nocardia nova TaxID=37330 RepID=A0A2S6A260_9NOCA|nr:DNA-binding protein [Nocardia nova]